MIPEAALYRGWVRHRRFLPKVHAFRYPLFLSWLDLDALEAVAERTPLFSVGRFNLLAFHEADYLPGRPGRTLRERLAAEAAAAGRTLPDGRIFLLTNLRTVGMGFNPVSYYYCFDSTERLAMVIAEVTNTPWKERHRYWMRPKPEQADGPWAFDIEKQMHVSPFMPMDLRYRWAFARPGAQLIVHMGLYDKAVLCFDANLKLERRPWSASQVYRTLLRYPWMTLKVVTAIHWEALWLWMKRVPVFTHPDKVKAPAS